MVWYRYEYITDMNVRHQEEQGAASLTPAPITCLPTWLLGRVLDSLPYPLNRPDELVRALAGLRSTHRCFTHEIVEGAVYNTCSVEVLAVIPGLSVVPH